MVRQLDELSSRHRELGVLTVRSDPPRVLRDDATVAMIELDRGGE